MGHSYKKGYSFTRSMSVCEYRAYCIPCHVGPLELLCCEIGLSNIGLHLLWTDSLHIRVVKLLHRVDIYISPNGSEIIHYICLSKTCRGLKFGLTPFRVLEQWLIKGIQKSCIKFKLALRLNLTMQIPYMHQLFTYNILLIDPYYHEIFISYL